MQTCHVDKFLNPTLISCSECLTRFGLEFQFTKATSFTRNVGGDDHETEAGAIIYNSVVQQQGKLLPPSHDGCL
jgi:hypothetical protein